MLDESFRRGVESIVAGLLRTHLVETVLSREEVRRALSPEALERLRREVVERLERSERAGREDRASVQALADSLLAATGASAATLQSVACWVAKHACSEPPVKENTPA